MIMPPCQFCDKPASIVYRATSIRPVPRCWDHAPTRDEAVAAGLFDQAQRADGSCPTCEPRPASGRTGSNWSTVSDNAHTSLAPDDNAGTGEVDR